MRECTIWAVAESVRRFTQNRYSIDGSEGHAHIIDWRFHGKMAIKYHTRLLHELEGGISS